MTHYSYIQWRTSWQDVAMFRTAVRRSVFLHHCLSFYVRLMLAVVVGGYPQSPVVFKNYSTTSAMSRSRGRMHLTLVNLKVNIEVTSSRTPLTRSNLDHTVLPANNTISLPVSISLFLRRLHHAYTYSERLSSTYYSFIDPNGWVGHVGWHTANLIMIAVVHLFSSPLIIITHNVNFIRAVTWSLLQGRHA